MPGLTLTAEQSEILKVPAGESAGDKTRSVSKPELNLLYVAVTRGRNWVNLNGTYPSL